MSVCMVRLLFYLNDKLADFLLGFLECLGSVFGGHYLRSIGLQILTLGQFVERVAWYSYLFHVLHSFAQ